MGLAQTLRELTLQVIILISKSDPFWVTYCFLSVRYCRNSSINSNTNVLISGEEYYYLQYISKAFLKSIKTPHPNCSTEFGIDSV